jgi:hypothetical protein
VNSKPKEDDDAEKIKEDNLKAYSRMMATIVQCEWIDNKSKLVQEMNAKEAQNYEQLYAHIKVFFKRCIFYFFEVKPRKIISKTDSRASN